MDALSDDQKPTKIYIAQPMAGLDRTEILNTRLCIEKMFSRENNAYFLNSYNPEWENIHPIEAIAKSLEILKDADLVVFFDKCWESSRGCRIEQLCCDLYDIPWTTVSKRDILTYLLSSEDFYDFLKAGDGHE